MPEDLTLSYTLTYERRLDGATGSISYCELREPDLLEIGSPEGSGATRTFVTKWEDRATFIENMIGWAKVAAAGENGINSDATGFNGKHIHRLLPRGYDMGLYNPSDGNPYTLSWAAIDESSTSTYPMSGWVFPTRYQCQPLGEKYTVKYPDGSYGPAAAYAKITLSYSALDYDLFADSNTRIYRDNSSGGGGQVSTMWEYNRYGRIVQKPASIFFKPPGQYLKLVDHPFLDYYPESVNLLDSIADFWVYLYDWPYDPITGINNCFGKVNKYAIFATPDFLEGQPAETLHFISADIIRQPLRMGARYWNCVLGFRKVYNIDLVAESGSGIPVVRGHNHIRYFDAQPPSQRRLLWYRLSVDGTTSMVPGNPFIDVEDFGKLFWIP